MSCRIRDESNTMSGMTMDQMLESMAGHIRGCAHLCAQEKFTLDEFKGWLNSLYSGKAIALVFDDPERGFQAWRKLKSTLEPKSEQQWAGGDHGPGGR